MFLGIAIETGKEVSYHVFEVLLVKCFLFVYEEDNDEHCTEVLQR